MKKIIVCFLFIVMSLSVDFTSVIAQESNSLDVVKKVEENLIYSKEVLQPENPGEVIINKGGWNDQDTSILETITVNKNENKINFEKKELKEDKESLAMKRKAFNAIEAEQYEVAVKIYKDILRKNKDDAYANLGLASAYQYLGQYMQAKPLFLIAAEDFPEDQQITANLLSIIIEESPYEAVYLITSIADKNKTSPLFQAQASLAYNKVGRYDEALDYIEKAIVLDDSNLEYRYNLAVIYDLKGESDKARYLYEQLLAAPVDYNSPYNLPEVEIQNRINELKYNSLRNKRG